MRRNGFSAGGAGSAASLTLSGDDSQRTNRTAPVPEGRAQRFLHLGVAVGELFAGAAAQGLTRLSRGEPLSLPKLLFAPANARRLAERLSTMRGAVMKVGQLMSMDVNGALPVEFAELFGGLRDQAHIMPADQLADTLLREYGSQWHRRFRSFSFKPIAAASIGQVHRAQTHDGRTLALKIQYPGVRKSIDSDMANLALLARTPGLVPPGLDLAALLERARDQLQHETDYRAEASALTCYRDQLGDDPVLVVPAVVEEHCTDHVLATEFATGCSLAGLMREGLSQAQRDHLASALCRLSVRELFHMQLVQTDPNPGNYLFDRDSGRVVLLDFGATEAISRERMEQLRTLTRALRDADRAATSAAAESIGFIAAQDPLEQTAAVIDMMLLAGEPLRHRGRYDFGETDLFNRVFEQGRAQLYASGYARTPPPDLIFLQRKFVGIFMLCSRLRARVDLAALFDPWL